VGRKCLGIPRSFSRKRVSISQWKRAFTLIELLIVVAIIAILAAIAVPNFLEAQVRAKVAATKADIRSLALASLTTSTGTNTLFIRGTLSPPTRFMRSDDPETVELWMGGPWTLTTPRWPT
jgi:prepilin-type N-terminal cleavage/methylation domain-containing protein